MVCKWCESEEAIVSPESAYWELPDGTRAVEIKEVPSVKCPSCGMVYVEEDLIGEIEEQMMLINTRNLPKEFTFEELMEQPRPLKKNYFNL